MADVLAAIVSRKRAEVADRLGAAEFGIIEPSRRSLCAALSRPGSRFIMEVKRASPSGHRARHSLEEAVAAYAPVADAISVLTDGPFFNGSLGDLRTVRSLFDGPILAKDFVVDPRQVAEARLNGADAVLAMMSVLDDATARAVMAEAERLAMDVIVEVHGDAELGRALKLGAVIVGINNRDLKTLKTDISVTERLAPLVPDDVVLISESGIATRDDVQRLAPLIDAFLVGSSLMAADDIAQAARSLVFGRVKVCGLTNLDDIALAAAAGATHAGFVFVPGTPRALDPADAEPLVVAARRAGMKGVGIFRDVEPQALSSGARRFGLDAVQLHGNEAEAEIGAVKQAFGGEVWTACAPGRDRGGDRLLFDNGAGGTGQSFDWQDLAGHPKLGDAFLAGGIGPDNAREAQATGVYGIDVGSRLERAPGRKDPDKVQALFDTLRPLDRKSMQ